ncbi:MAG TPA: VOC family protein [Ktedonobacterales bacterium]|jgi:predicted enzyme related to lactoylglutathione lyase
MNLTLNFILLHVRDIAAERDFYKDALGLEVEGQSPDFVGFQSNGAATLALSTDGPAAPQHNVELWWQVDQADALHAALEQRGVTIVSAPKDETFGRAFSAKDPEGNQINFYQPRQA